MKRPSQWRNSIAAHENMIICNVVNPKQKEAEAPDDCGGCVRSPQISWRDTVNLQALLLAEYETSKANKVLQL